MSWSPSKKLIAPDWPSVTGMLDWPAETLEEFIQEHFVRSTHNIGINCHNVAVVDCDSVLAHRVIADTLGGWPSGVPQVESSPSHTQLYFVNDSTIKNRVGLKVEGYAEPDGGKVRIDLRGVGGQTAAPPSIHPLGHAYRWIVERDVLPEMPEALQPSSPRRNPDSAWSPGSPSM